MNRQVLRRVLRVVRFDALHIFDLRQYILGESSAMNRQVLRRVLRVVRFDALQHIFDLRQYILSRLPSHLDHTRGHFIEPSSAL